MISKYKINTHLTILFAALLLGLLFEVQTIVKMTDVIKMGKPIESSWILDSIWSFVVSVFVFYLTAAFNLFWKKHFFTSARFRKLNPMLIIAANILLFFMLSVLSTILFESRYDKQIPIIYYSFEIWITFLFAILFAHILIFIKKARTAEIDNAHLKEEKAKAELASLKEQISPHFLFNTLSSLSSVIRQDDKKSSL
ncbi:histidine kinase [candidate division KSB1 bacterium]|nr:histidine kinase [candidate division KSB1 bacterium]RQV99974.1 MAG: histidine kinase [candidate division KSB1 bacterium]